MLPSTRPRSASPSPGCCLERSCHDCYNAQLSFPFLTSPLPSLSLFSFPFFSFPFSSVHSSEGFSIVSSLACCKLLMCMHKTSAGCTCAQQRTRAAFCHHMSYLPGNMYAYVSSTVERFLPSWLCPAHSQVLVQCLLMSRPDWHTAPAKLPSFLPSFLALNHLFNTCLPLGLSLACFLEAASLAACVTSRSASAVASLP